METVAGIFINYLASIVLAAFFFAHVSDKAIEWWWYYFTPISVILIVLADTWLFKLEEKESYYRYVLRMFGGIYAVSILASLAGLFWRF